MRLGRPKRNVSITVYSGPEELGQAVAEAILNGVTAAKEAGRDYLLGCPVGTGLNTVYAELARQAQEGKADLSNVVIVLLDEYVAPTQRGFTYCDAEAPFSSRRFAREYILKVINAGLVEDCRIRGENVWCPDPYNPQGYDLKLQISGGVDMFLLTVGGGDGHIGFNPPGTTLDSVTRVIPLVETTHLDYLDSLPEVTDFELVPRVGVSVGLGTIVKFSKETAIIMYGEQKQNVSKLLLDYNDFTPSWPASFIYRCRKGHVLLDKAAAAKWEEA